MYTAKDASVAFSLMEQRLQPSNTALLMEEYFTVCRLYGDTSVARDTHQRYVTQIESMRSILSTQTLRNSEHEVFRGNVNGRTASAAGGAQKTAVNGNSARDGSSSSSSSAAATTGAQGSSSTVGRSPASSSTAAAATRGRRGAEHEKGMQPGSSDSVDSGTRYASDTNGRGSWSRAVSGVEASRGASRSGHPNAGQQPTAHTTSGLDGNTRNAASYAILRREWGHENYEEQFHKPWNAFLGELSAVMTEVVTAWVSDLDECTHYSRHLVWRSSTCCYDAAHGMCLLRWNTMREVRAYVDALHAVVNAPLSSFFVPLALAVQVLGVPVLCLSLAPVTGPWQGWDSVGVVWHSFCGLCANLRLMRPLDRAEGGRSEVGNNAFLSGLAGSAAHVDAAAGSATAAGAAHNTGGLGSALDGSVAWSLLRQLEPATASGDAYYGANTNSSSGGIAPMTTFEPSARHFPGATAAAWEQRRHSVFYGEPTSLANAAVVSSRADRVGRQVLTAAAAGQGGPFTRSGGLHLLAAIGGDARWYFVDARAICLYQWYARSSWMAARVPRREMFFGGNGCVQRSVGPNKLILQSKLRIMVGQLLNGLMRFSSAATHASSLAGGGSYMLGQRTVARGRPPVLLSTLCHSHGVRYGTYVYAIVDLLRTEEASLDEAVQTAYRLGSAAPNKLELLKQCRRCLQAIVGELVARVIKHLIYEEWYVVMRQNPDWLHRFHSLCTAVAEAEEAGAAATAEAEAEVAAGAESAGVPHTASASCDGKAKGASLSKGSGTASAPAASCFSSAGETEREEANRNAGSTVAATAAAAAVVVPPEAEAAGNPRLRDESAAPTTPGEPTMVAATGGSSGGDGIRSPDDGDDVATDDASTVDGVSAVLRQRRLLQFIAETRESLGAPLLDAVRRVLNGVFIVNLSSSSGSYNGGGGVGGGGGGGASSFYSNSPSVDHNLSLRAEGASGLGNVLEQAGSDASASAPASASAAAALVTAATPTASAAAASALHASLSGGGVSITEPSSRFTTDEAGRSLATSSAQALGGYPMFNPQLSSVAFRRSMFEELMLAVNERYVARVYSGNEKMSEWQLLHKRAPVVVRRSQFARSPSSTSGTALGGLSSTVNGMTSNVGGGNSVTGGGAGTGGGATSGGAGGANNNNSVGGSATTASAAGAAAAAAAAGGTGNGNGGNNSGSGAESWSARTAGRSTVLGSRSASAPPPPTSARGRTTTSRLRGAIPVYYPAADEESIQAEAKDLFPGWSLQCLEEMIGVPLVLRQNRVDVDSSFTGAALLRALSPAFLSGMPTTAAADVYSADHAHRRPYGLSGTVMSGPSGGAGEAAALTRTLSTMTAAAAAATLAVVPPLTPGCPLRSAVWGTTLELPLCLSSGTIEGALDYAQHQREIGMAIVASGMSAPVISHGRHGTSSTVWRERNPHMEYMGKLIQLHSADVRIACRGWPIVEDFDFLKPMEPSGESMLSGGVGRPMWPRQRSLETALAHRHNVARLSGVAAAAAAGVGGGDARGSLGQDLAAVGASTEEARIALCFNASMHVRLSTLSARIDLHEAMSAMWQLTECIESMNGSHAVYGYLLRQKIDIIATVAANFTASGVTTALEAAIADLDVLTGGMFNFSSVDDMRGRNGATPLRLSREDESGVNSYGRRVGRYDGRAASRSALGSAERRPRFAAVPSSLSPSSFPGEEADAASALPGTPDGSQAPTVEPAQQQQPAAHGADTDSAAVNGGSVGDTDAAGLSMDRLRSLPVPPPITPRQVAAVTAAARRAGHSADAANPLALRASLTDTGRPADVLASATPTPLVGSLGAFKSFLLRSVQCVDLYSTLLELLTRHMLLPDTRRTPKESLSRAVMFCSLRRELIVMTHGESSVEAAMAASDVGLLLLQSPKTWSQAKTEFYRARRSLAVHLRAVVHSGNGRGGSALAETEGELTTSGVSGFALESHGGGGGGGELLSGHASRLADPNAASGGRQRAHGIDTPGGRSPAHSQASRLASSSSSPLARHGAAGALTPLPRESWATAPDRLKQALCSVLNNIAYLYCRQAQRQYAVSQQSMSAYIRAARRHNTLHKASTGLALYERRQRRAAKVEHLLNEATATLRGVLSHAADTPAYDYAVALNNQASVLLHRYQYAAARRLLLQSLRITTQLQSFSVAPVTLPPSLVSPQGSGELGSVLWLLEPVQLQLAVDSASTTAARSQAYGDQDDDDGMLASRGTPPPSAALSSTSKRAGVGAGAEPWPSTLQSRTPQRGGASLSGAKGDADKASFTPPSSPRSLKSGGGEGRAPAALRREAVRVPRAPNALTVIAAMLKVLGAPLDEDGDGTSGGLFFSGAGGIGNSGSGDGGAAAYEYYYAAGGAAPRDGRATAIDRATATAAAAAAPISISAAEQLRNCQVHTLRMLYQLEVQKSYIERLRVQRLFRRYLAAWRVRRETRRIRAAAELYRFGVGAMTRVFLARRYRFSGYHWWMRQPGAIRRHLDPLLDQAALTTRRQLWDVWNAQVETSVLVLQRVLRAAAVRRDMAAQFQFRQFYFQRCRPAVEAAVWAKMNVVYSSVLLHLHVQDGVRRMAALKETVLSGAMWLASATEPLQAQEAARRVGLRIHELQRREALERDSIKTLSRLRRRQLQVEEMKESVLIAIRSPRPSIEGAPSGGAPTAAVLPQPSRQPVPAVPPLHLSEMMQRGGGVEARAAWPPHGDPAALAPADHSAPHGTQTDVAASAGRAAAAEPRAIPHAPAATPLVPYSDAAPGHHGVFASPSLSDAELYAYGGDHGLAGLPYTPPAAFNTPSSGSAIFASAAGTPATATTAAAAGGGGGAGNVPPSPTPTSSPMGELAPAASFSSVSRARRARQVVIQADTADLEAEVAPSPRSTHASEERHRQMQRQYREDERVKMSQLLRQLHSHHPAHPPPIDEDGAPSPDDGDWSAEATHKTAEKSAVGSTAHDASGGRRSPVSFTSEDANMKWRQARQRAGAADPWASITTTPRSESPGEEHRGQQQPAAAAAGGGGSGAVLMAASPGANREADSGAVTSSPPSSFPAPFTRPAVLEPAPPGAAAPRPQTPPRERRPLLLPQPISGAGGVVDLVSVPASPAPSSPAASSAAVSTSTNASSRVAVAAAEAQRHQLEQASHILLQFWWTKRALPTYVTASLASHRLYCEHMMQLHALWVDKKAVRWRARQITLQEARGRYTLWQEESVEAASLLLLQVHGARCCRDLDSYAKWLRTTATTAERRGRSAVMLAVAPQERLAPLPPPA